MRHVVLFRSFSETGVKKEATLFSSDDQTNTFLSVNDDAVLTVSRGLILLLRRR